jgi:hypothetical protein
MKARLSVRLTLPYLLFAALVVVFLWKPIFAGKALLPGDYLAEMHPWKGIIRHPDPPPQWNPLQWDAIAQFYPWRVFYAKCFRQGIIPLWNPHQFCGTPFLANGQSAVLYPPNLFFLIFDPITAFTVYAAVHLFLAAAFTYLLLRMLGCGEFAGIISGIAFAFCAFMVRWLELPTFVGAAVWLPAALFLIQRAVEKRSVFYGMLSGVAIALAVLAGHFQIAFYVFFASLLWWLWKLGQVWKNDGRGRALSGVVLPFIGCIIVFGLISAAQLLPTLELARISHRASNPTPEGYNWFIGNSLKPYHLITAFIPDFYGNPASNNFVLLGRLDETRHTASAADYIEYGMYVGVLSVILALIGLWSVRRPNVGFFALLSGLALLCALGTPVNLFFYHFVPGFSSLGGPNRILLLYMLGVAALAGLGADQLATRAPDATRLMGRIGYRNVLAVATTAIVAVACYLIARSFLVQDMGVSEPPEPFISIAGRFVVFFLAAAMLTILRSENLISRGIFAIAAVGLIVADLFAAGINYNPICDRSSVYPQTELTDKLKKIAENKRIAPINPHWNLFATPEAVMPPNSAMVYGLYDVQGYDSLYTREYKDWLSRIQGEDCSPIENGNIVFIKSRQADLGEIIGFWIGPTNEAWPVPRSLPLAWRLDRLPDSPRLKIQTPVRAFLNPNRVRFTLDSYRTERVYAQIPDYPGWLCKTSSGKMLSSKRTNFMLISANVGNLSNKERSVEFQFDPLSFRLGLFLSLIGAGTVSCAGTCELLRRKYVKS